MAVRTKSLAMVVIPALTVAPVVYTCPAGHTALVKLVTVFNAGPVGGVTPGLSVLRAATTYGVHTFAAVGTGSTVEWPDNGDMALVLAPGDQLVVSKGATNIVHVTVSGAELAGVAP